MRIEGWQGGLRVFVVEADDPQRARSEAMHYAIQYAQDGPVTLKEKADRKRGG